VPSVRPGLEAARRKILEYLRARGGCAYAVEVREGAGVAWPELVEALAELEVSGLVYRRGEPLDVTKPVATTMWCAREGGQAGGPAAIGEVVGIVASPPVVRRAGGAIPMILGLPEFLEEFVCSAREDMRMIMPYLSGLAGHLFARCLGALRGLKFIRVITEEEEGNIRTLERLKQYLSNLEVAYATRYAVERGVRVKVEGAHAKVIVVDGRYALVGTFNLTEVHLLANYDIGILVAGGAAAAIARVFDALWEALHGSR